MHHESSSYCTVAVGCSRAKSVAARLDYGILHSNLLLTLSSHPGLMLFIRHLGIGVVHISA